MLGSGAHLCTPTALQILNSICTLELEDRVASGSRWVGRSKLLRPHLTPFNRVLYSQPAVSYRDTLRSWVF